MRMATGGVGSFAFFAHCRRSSSSSFFWAMAAISTMAATAARASNRLRVMAFAPDVRAEPPHFNRSVVNRPLSIDNGQWTFDREVSMPTYVYEVINADGSGGEVFEIDQRMSDPPL